MYQLVMLTVHSVKEQNVRQIKHKTTKQGGSHENRRFTRDFHKCLNSKNQGNGCTFDKRMDLKN